MNDILSAVTVTLASVILLAAIGFGIRWALRLYGDRTKSNRDLATAMLQASERFAAAAEACSKAANGITEISVVQIKGVERLHEAVEIFRKSIFGRDERGFIPFDESQADMQYEIDDLMRRGISHEEAVARVQSHRLWKEKGKAMGQDPFVGMRLE